MLPLAFFKSFQMDRFCFIYPAMCFVLLGKACDVLFSQQKKILLLSSCIISVVCIGVVHKEYAKNLLLITGHNYSTVSPSYSQFYDEDLFLQIAKDINMPQDYSVKVVSVGMFPSIASYNGFWSLDGYMSSYSLDYKHSFRRVISKELEKDDAIKKYFDDWGSRCYVFSSELYKRKNQYLCGKDEMGINDLDLSIAELRDLGCQYIFSSVDIINYEELGLSFINQYTTDKSYWKIRVYKII